jgi:hypothetical protein
MEPARSQRAAPKRGAAKAAPKSSRRSLRKELDSLVTFINLPVSLIAPQDALDPTEQAALVDALDAEAKRSARFHKALEGLITFSSGGSLGIVAATIAARRVARHGVFGPQLGSLVDGLGGQYLAMTNAKPSEAAAEMGKVMDMFRTVQNDDAQPAGSAGTEPPA